MASVNCPKCGLVNPDSAQACDCGYPLKGKSLVAVPSAQPIKAIIVGADIPFWDLVWLMVKWVVAAIPAAIIVTVMAFGAYAALGFLGTIVGARH